MLSAYRHLRALTAFAALSLLTSPIASSQTTFSAHTLYNTPNALTIIGHGDFNNDGREDFVVLDSSSPTTFTNLLFLSNGDGTYDAPIALASHAELNQFVTADFNHDGKLDFAAYNSSTKLAEVYTGNGDGTFVNSVDLSGTSNVVALVAVDMNHDSSTDVVMVNSAPGGLLVWLSSGTGSFSGGASVSSGVINATYAVAGDFDGDGKPDIALIAQPQGATTVQVWYGDGKGNIGSPAQLTDPNGLQDNFDPNAIGDLDNNGTSDLVMSRERFSPSSPTQYPQIAVFKGNSNRTLSFSTVNTTNGCPSDWIQIADYNGDGLNDLVYSETPCNAAGTTNIVVNPATAKGVFGGSEQVIYSTAYGIDGSIVNVKSTQGTRPDLLLAPYTAAFTNGAPPMALVLLENSSTGAFPACGTTAQAEGINVCMPSGTSANSPVNFSVSASGPNAMRTAAVWVDGQKVTEQLTHAFSNYSFLDASLPLSNGSHSITLYGTGWDDTLQVKSFNLNVGSGSGCGAPASPGVNVCAPVDGTTVGSPTTVSAAANIVGTLARMEIWVDGAKLFTETTSTSFTTTLNLANGYHSFAIYAVNTAGTKYETTVHATVGPPSSCAADAAYDVHVCSPTNNGTSGSPVQATATAHITGALARMEVWVDNAKMFTETTSLTLNTSIALAPGKYRFTFYAVNTQNTKWVTTVYTTVQ